VSEPIIARRYRVHGRVQGVGFRAFVHRNASKLGLTGWVRNVDDGSVEAHAQGPAGPISTLEGLLRTGPRWGEVRHVDVMESSPLAGDGFVVKR
jgi:acylphosphatase